MYCKKCGKKLPDSSRFCDRCGQPTNAAPKKSRPKQDAPKRRQNDSYDNYRKKKMQHEVQRRRRQRQTRIITVWAIIIAILVAVGAGFGAYYITMKNLTENKVTASPSPSASTSAASEAPSESAAAQKSEAAQDSDNSGCDIYIDKSYGFKCAYPSDFETGTLANSNTKLSLKDPSGDGEMLISCEKVSESQTMSVLLRDYVKGIGVEPDFNRAGDDWYTVTFTRNGKVNHRKAVLFDKALLVYYDFTFSEGSDNKAKYSGYITYIDEYIEKQLHKTSDEDKNSKATEKTAKSSDGE